MNNSSTGFDRPSQVASQLKSFISRNPASAISIGYFALSLIGLSFTWFLFREFEIDYFEFADVTDFLMATLREPVSIGLVIVAAVVGWCVRWLTYIQYRWYHAKKRGKLAKWFHMLNGVEWSMRTPAIWWFLFIVYCFYAINIYVEIKSRDIREGNAATVSYLLAEYADGSEPVSAMLLGTSARFVFVYDAKTRITKVIPQESLVFLSFEDKVLESEDRSADSAVTEEPSAANQQEQGGSDVVKP